MGKNKKKNAGGPYLAAALFCDQVVEGKDGALSITRITDQIQLLIPENAPADFPSKEKPAAVNISGILCFKTGYSRGENREVGIVMRSPSGKKSPFIKQKMAFTKEPQGGGNLILRGVVIVHSGGLFWFDIYLDGKLMGRMPVQITFARQQPTPSPQPPSAQTLPAPSPNGSKKPRRKRRR